MSAILRRVERKVVGLDVVGWKPTSPWPISIRSNEGHIQQREDGMAQGFGVVEAQMPPYAIVRPYGCLLSDGDERPGL